MTASTRSSTRSRAVPIVAALVCILGIGLAAATLTSAVPIGASDEVQLIDPPTPREAFGGGNSGQNPGVGPSGEGDADNLGRQAGAITICIEALNTGYGTLGYLAAFLVFSAVLYRRFNLPITLFVGWTVFPPYMLAYFMTTDCGVEVGGSPIAGSIALDSASDRLVEVSTIPPWVVVAGVALMVVAVGVVLYRSAWTEDHVIPEEDTTDEPPEADAFAAAAGRAADRIEKHNAAVDNAVYGAWVEMTGLLEVDRPDTYTPEEFADAAIGVGLDRDDVGELTELFNEVRYGEMDADPRADRAVAVLRRIETQYADTTSDATAADDADTENGQ